MLHGITIISYIKGGGLHICKNGTATWFLKNGTWHSRLRTCSCLVLWLHHHRGTPRFQHIIYEPESSMDLFAHSHAQPVDHGTSKLMENHSLAMERWIWIEGTVLSYSKSNMGIMGIFGVRNMDRMHLGDENDLPITTLRSISTLLLSTPVINLLAPIVKTYRPPIIT